MYGGRELTEKVLLLVWFRSCIFYLVPSLGTNWWKWVLRTYSVNIWYLWSGVSFVAMVVVSLMTQEPDKATQKMVDEVRIPSGRTVTGK